MRQLTAPKEKENTPHRWPAIEESVGKFEREAHLLEPAKRDEWSQALWDSIEQEKEKLHASVPETEKLAILEELTALSLLEGRIQRVYKEEKIARRKERWANEKEHETKAEEPASREDQTNQEHRQRLRKMIQELEEHKGK